MVTEKDKQRAMELLRPFFPVWMGLPNAIAEALSNERERAAKIAASRYGELSPDLEGEDEVYARARNLCAKEIADAIRSQNDHG